MCDMILENEGTFENGEMSGEKLKKMMLKKLEYGRPRRDTLSMFIFTNSCQIRPCFSTSLYILKSQQVVANNLLKSKAAFKHGQS